MMRDPLGKKLAGTSGLFLSRHCILVSSYMNFLRSLANPAFALLWSGQTISRLGDSLYTIALAWWMLEKTGSATAW
jgi:hypothetical protein